MKTPGNYLKSLVVAVICSLPLIAASQDVGWRWQNPYLQGNDLNSIVMNGSQLSPGVYYYRLQVGEHKLAKKCIIF